MPVLGGKSVAVAVVLYILMPVTGRSQEFCAVVNSHVTDPTRASVPRAHVVVTHTATGIATATDMDVNGPYQMLFLDSGTIRSRLAAPGFKESVRAEFECA